MRHIILTVMGAALLAAPVAKADEGKGTLQAIGMGRALYLTNCAQCHGADARGAALGVKLSGKVILPPDLTTIALRDGRFDPLHVAFHINTPYSGVCTTDMPCWGPIFKEKHGSGYADLQTWNLVKYLQFAQQAER